MAHAQAPLVTPADSVKIAAVQVQGYDKGDMPRDDYDVTKALIPYIHRAGQDKAQLVVFPEYLLGRIKVPGPVTDKIAAAAKANKLHVIIGCWELLERDAFANTALIFDRRGAIVGKYRKTHAAVDHYEGAPPWTKPKNASDRSWLVKHDPEWIMEKGQELPVFDLGFGKVGLMTCYDGWFPEPARVLSLRGAEIIVWINGRGGLVEDFIVKSTMFRNHVAMVTANQSYGGGTTIGDCSQWPVRIACQAPAKEDAYITATVQLKSLRKLRATSRNFAQRRPDLYGEILRPVQ